MHQDSVWGSLTYLAGRFGHDYVTSYGVTLRIGVISFLGGLLLAILLTMARISPIPPLRTAVSGYVEIFRNIPVLCLLLFIVYGLPEVGFTLDYEPSVIATLILVSSAFGCDNLRSGINAVDPGQIEAARSLGHVVWRHHALHRAAAGAEHRRAADGHAVHLSDHQLLDRRARADRP
jgi:His/Glu/Gln/Arg/opine family amino acid ABC transporter permease subunit